MNKLKWTYYINCLLAILLVPFSVMHAWSSIGTPIGAKGSVITDAVPAGFAFSIWWVIFFASIYYALSLIYSGKKEYQHIAELSAVGYALSLAWVVIVQLTGPNPLWFTPLILIGAYIAMTRAYLKALGLMTKMKKPSYLRAVIPLGLYAGWIGLALFINISVVLETSGTVMLGLSASDQSAFLIFCAAVLSFFILQKTKGEPSYAVAVAWGLIGICAAHFKTLAGDTALLALVGVILSTLLLRYTKT